MNDVLRCRFIAMCASLLFLSGPTVTATSAATSSDRATVEQITVHGPSLLGNLQGNSVDREVFVVLPPSYGRDADRHYPVVYVLHGFLMTARDFLEMARIAEGSQAAFAGGAEEMIIVVPDAATLFGGSLYSNSPTVGDFESFVARDLVNQIDSNYRTIADRRSRGLAGHSMGGYGAIRISMKHPEVFSSLYAMSPCCLTPRSISPEFGKSLEAMTLDQILRANTDVRSTFAGLAAWSPAPDKPPLFVDIGTEDGVVQPDVLAQWAANAPTAMAPQYLPALRQMTGIAIDIGDEDELLPYDLQMHELLIRFGIAHEWTIYSGDHVNRVAERFEQEVMPFFATRLQVSISHTSLR